MWIRSITLLNFKSYAGANFNFPEPKNGRNLVLVGAQNGHGKTTLLEAIYFCLYDKDAIYHLSRAGLTTEDIPYQTFLKKALFEEAVLEMPLKRYKMGLQIEVCKRRLGMLETLRITRYWYFNEKRECVLEDRETRVVLFRDDGSGQPPKPILVEREDIGYFVNNYALPFDYAPYFFFDGEKIVQTAQRIGAGKWLHKALKGLLGVTLLDHLKENLIKYRTGLISNKVSQETSKKLLDVQKRWELGKLSVNGLEHEYDEIQLQRDRHTEEIERLIGLLGGGQDIKTVEDLVGQLKDTQADKEKFLNQIKDTVLQLPLALLPNERMRKLNGQLDAEAKRLDWEAGKNQISSRVDDFWRSFHTNQKVREVMGDMADVILCRPKMKEALRECWEQLFYPLPPDHAEKLEHNYLSKQAYVEICNHIERLNAMPNRSFEDLLNQIEQCEQRERDLEGKIKELEGTSHDNWVQQLKEARAQEKNFTSEAVRIEAKLESERAEFRQLEQEMGRLHEEMQNSNPKLLKSKRAGQIEKMIDELSGSLLEKKVQNLGATATRINNSIVHDQRIHQIQIGSDGSMMLLNQKGGQIEADSSAGQMQILIMSLVSALAEVTRYQAPYVIDTPLARLDLGHREGLFKHWSALTQQVILLSQDTEITSEVRRELESYVGKTYLVKAVPLGTGGMRSQVCENSYF